jgi:hypothetical protein
MPVRVPCEIPRVRAKTTQMPTLSSQMTTPAEAPTLPGDRTRPGIKMFWQTTRPLKLDEEDYTSEKGGITRPPGEATGQQISARWK